ncbi:hypothetical protein B488_11920 [Liberibacter crescens BT-1]|uniref:Uncharacterized protein n=1 Tax=Liberibacter crescens (strain BT-1) TaxID=1215343 RepID=L0EUF5_LIBCB|nr:hypothetical protein B488_11920 [Liberibacter crescens BT-1]
MTFILKISRYVSGSGLNNNHNLYPILISDNIFSLKQKVAPSYFWV